MAAATIISNPVMIKLLVNDINSRTHASGSVI